MKQGLLLVVPAVLALGLAACRTPSSGIVVESYPQNKITINSKIVGGRLDVVAINAAQRNNRLQAQVEAQNKSQRDIRFEYRFRWLDKNAMETAASLSLWTPLQISAREKVYLQAMAPNTEADNFILEVRFPRPSTRW